MHQQSSHVSFFLRRLSLVIASAGFVAACSTGAGGPAPDADSAASSAELTSCRALEHASSSRTRRCSTARLFPFDDVHAAHFAEACAASLTARGARLDAAQVTACAAALEGTACGDESPVACELARGALIDGTACVSGAQCVSGNCARKPAESCGHCAASASLGDLCDTWMVGLMGGCGQGRCAWVFDLGNGSVAAQCAETARAAGAPCGEDLPRCSEGFYCARVGASRWGSCTSGLAAGASCAPSSGDDPQCGLGMSCIEGKCRGKGALGDACTGYGFTSFIVDSCDDGLACDLESKTCLQVSLGKAGDACDDAALRCDHGFCDYAGGSVGKCIAWMKVGGACDANDVRDRCEGLSSCRSGTCQLDDPAACN